VVQPISTKFGVLTQFGALDRSDRYIFKNLKIQDGSSRHLWKSKNHQRLPQNLARRRSLALWSVRTVKNLKF